MLNYVTPSMLQDYLLCPNQYYFRYVQKLKTPVNAPAWLGTKVHEAIQLTLAARVRKSKEAGPPFNESDYCQQAFAEKITDLRNYKGETLAIDWKEGETPEALKEKGRQLIDLYTKCPEFIEMDVRESERSIELLLSPDLERQTFRIAEPQDSNKVTVLCRLDAILADQTIVDFKTSSRAYLVDDVKQKIQFDLYAIALFADRFSNLDQNFKIRCDVLIKTKEPKLQIIEIQKTRLDRDIVLKEVFHLCKGIDAGLFYRRPNIFCNGYCAFKNQCQKGAIA